MAIKTKNAQTIRNSELIKLANKVFKGTEKDARQLTINKITVEQIKQIEENGTIR